MKQRSKTIALMTRTLACGGFYLLLLFFFPIAVFSQEYIRSSANGFVLDNGVVSRYVKISQDGRISTAYITLANSASNFAGKSAQAVSLDQPVKTVGSLESDEFYFELDGAPVTGKSGWNVANMGPVAEKEGKGIALTLTGKEGPLKDITVNITYLLYPGLPVIRKKISFRNTGQAEHRLEGLEMEKLVLGWNTTDTRVLRNYGRNTYIGPFTGDWDDPAVIVHDQPGGRGLVLGNETPGVLKKTSVNLDGRTFTIGLTGKTQEYPFRKWLRSGENWESPYTFIVPYTGDDFRTAVDGALSDFVRKYMGIRLAAVDYKPTFVYNTWAPFRTEVNEKLMFELIDAAAESGIEEFILDDGWETRFGDWDVDTKKFPNGLKPVFDRMKARGMKKGIWISLAAVSSESRIVKEHPEWIIRDKNGEMTNLHESSRKELTADLTSPYRDYIKSVILKLIRENDLQYVKLDLAIVTSAYMFDREVSGSYARDQKAYKDRQESFLEIYRSAWQLFDELHQEVPGLFIDCTFETMGALQLIDYDMCKHAEGNWLSNFYEDAPKGSLRVRQAAWQRAPVIPATAMIIGNQRMDGANAVLSLQSLAGAMPIMLGDPRKLTTAQRADFRKWSAWLRGMQNKHQYLLYRQDLAGFGEPAEGMWDGFQRINTETKAGGILGVFRQGGVETTRQVTVRFLDPVRRYAVKEALTGKTILQATGKQLAEKGFTVTMTGTYEGRLYEIATI